MIKKALAVLTSAMITVSAVCAGGISASAASGATGVGLAEHAMEAYYEDWSYVYGGSTPGAVDCSGLFVTYYGVGGNRTNLVVRLALSIFCKEFLFKSIPYNCNCSANSFCVILFFIL